MGQETTDPLVKARRKLEKEFKETRLSYDSVHQINEGLAHIGHGCHLIRQVIEREHRQKGSQVRDFNAVEDALLKIEEVHSDLDEKFDGREEDYE